MTTLRDADGSQDRADPAGGARDAAQWLQRGVDAAGRDDAAEAIASFRQVVALRPDLVAAHANLGLLLVATERSAEAEPHLRIAVERLPGDATLRNALGVAQESADRLVDAESNYRAAIAARPGFAEAHANLGNCLRRQGRADEARSAYLHAIELSPGFAVAHYNLGVLLQDLEDHESAIVHYRSALAQRGDYVEALNNLGTCLKNVGAVDEARATFERILALRPHQIEAHCNLAQFKTYAADDPQVHDLLSQRHRLPSLSAQGRVRYWFTAGKMLEDAGRFDDAFAAYAEGNGAKHAQTPWDEAAHRDLQRRIAATFTREVMARAMSHDTADGPTPVFIVGMPRSGTSLIEQVLATLPGVHGAGEITALAEVLQSAAGEFDAGTFRFPESLGDASIEMLHRLGRRYVERLRALAPRATHVVDKLPANFMHTGLIHLMLPQARIVHAMRDPMDACFSCYSRLFGGGNLGFTYDLGTLARYWLGYDDLMRHWRDVLPAGRLLDVPYETMVADFENQARRLVDYLGLPWDERCLGFHDHPRAVKTASVAQVRRPLYRTSVARWRAFERHLAALHAVVDGRYAH